MTKFHINPNTGNPNVCPDKLQCKFTSEEGVVPPHYATKDEAKKAVEDQIFTAFSATETPSSAPETASDTSEPADNPGDPEDKAKRPAGEPLGPECFENAVKVARKTVIDLIRKKRIARVKFKKLKKKVKKKARKLKSLRSKLKKQS